LSILSSIILKIFTYPQRQPTDTVFSFANFLFIREYLTSKQIEFFDSGFKQFSRNEMS
jgi:hypothetical protein